MLLHSQIWVCEIFIYIKNVHNVHNAYRDPKNTKLVQVRNFLLPFWVQGFSTRGERDSIFFYPDFSIWPHHVRHPAANYWSGLGELWKSTCFVQAQISTNCFFQIPKSSAHRFRAWRHLRPWSYFLPGVFIVTSVMSHPPRTRVNTCTQCLHLTNPCTKPKGSQPN